MSMPTPKPEDDSSLALQSFINNILNNPAVMAQYTPYYSTLIPEYQINIFFYLLPLPHPTQQTPKIALYSAVFLPLNKKSQSIDTSTAEIILGSLQHFEERILTDKEGVEKFALIAGTVPQSEGREAETEILLAQFEKSRTDLGAFFDALDNHTQSWHFLSTGENQDKIDEITNILVETQKKLADITRRDAIKRQMGKIPHLIFSNGKTGGVRLATPPEIKTTINAEWFDAVLNRFMRLPPDQRQEKMNRLLVANPAIQDTHTYESIKQKMAARGWERG